MKITIKRTIFLENIRHSRVASKTYNWETVPRVGDNVWTTAFHRDEEVQVIEVHHDFDNKEIHVWLEPLHLESNEIINLKNTVDMYLLHEWECSYYELENV